MPGHTGAITHENNPVRQEQMNRTHTLLLSSALIAACSTVRPPEGGRRACVSWVDEVDAVLTGGCADCHSGNQPDGSYDTTTYLGILGNGLDDVPNVVAGDAASRLLAVLDPSAADADHATAEGDFDRIREWVVDCDASYFNSPVHERGILNPADDDFHGALLRSRLYDFELCASCHGDDFAGGAAEKPCTTCHEDGPTACNVCHGSSANPAPLDAHQRHVVGGPLEKMYDCTECHVEPQAWDDVGHILLADGTLDEAPAEITFGDLAGLDGDGRTGPPSWSPDTGECSNVYCHGGALGDDAADNPVPVWTGTDQADCGSCHGLPPQDHAQDQCGTCHERVADDSPAIIDTALHLNGEVTVGDGSGECTGCHGNADSPAPPRDLNGETSATLVTVGAHRAHLTANRLRGPVPCDFCHLVPDDVSAPGHLDSTLPAEVFPDDPGFDSLGLADGATIVWERGAATCTTPYCHGGGDSLSADVTVGLVRSPDWTLGPSQAFCGACHGLPPDNGMHIGGLAITDCVACHPSTVDAVGAIVITGPVGEETSTHINGEIDVP